jgi:hypothetical protein
MPMTFARPRGWWVALLTGVVVALFSPLVHACPSDPSRTAAFYDDPDFDDVVDFIHSSAGVVAITTTLPKPTLRTLGVVADAEDVCPAATPGVSPPTRSPPVSPTPSL